jgi:hypothetical protein
MKNEVRKRGVFLIIGLFFSFGLISQYAVLEGRIYSSESFENISHANVILKNSDGLVVTSITTGFDGRYKTDSLKAGAYQIEVFAKEFETQAIEIVYLQEGKAATIDISMSKKALAEVSEPLAADPEITPMESPEEEEPEKKFKFFEFIGDIMKTSAIAAF